MGVGGHSTGRGTGRTAAGWTHSVGGRSFLGPGSIKDGGGRMHQSMSPRCSERRKSFRISTFRAPIPCLLCCQGLRSCPLRNWASSPLPSVLSPFTGVAFKNPPPTPTIHQTPLLSIGVNTLTLAGSSTLNSFAIIMASRQNCSWEFTRTLPRLSSLS